MIIFHPRIPWRSYFFFVLLISDVAISLPLPPTKRSPQEVSGTARNGFSTVPRVLEIQLPLKIATKEDLVAWARYVMGLMASKINITLTSVKDPPSRFESIKNSSKLSLNSTRQKQTIKENPIPSKTTANEVKSTQDFPGHFSRIKETNINPFTSIGTFDLPNSQVQQQDFKKTPFQLVNSLRTRDDQQQFLPQYPDFGTRPTFDATDDDIFRNTNVITAPPSGMYLPLPARTSDSLNFSNNLYATRYFFDGVERNSSGNLEIPFSSDRYGSRKNENSERLSRIKTNDQTTRGNVSNGVKPILTLPFEAVITITREEVIETTTEKDIYSFVPPRDPPRNPPDEFPPYFEKNYTLANESGRINVVFDDVDDGERELFSGETQKEEKKKEDDKRKEKKQRSKKEKTRKRQSSTLGDLLRMLGIIRRNSTSGTSVSPIKSFRGTSQQQIDITNQKPPPEEKRNGTSEAQEIEDDDEEEEMGGSIQALIDLLPLVAPILDDLSDPESETDISELLQAAIPILEGLSEGDEYEEGVDIPGVLVPILLNIIEGKDGQGDSGAVLGPLIQLVAPLIGPLVGPLIGPLSRQISNTPEEGGSSSGSIVQALIGPLSQPTGYGKMSPASTLIAGVVSSLSKGLVNGDFGVDLSMIVKAVVTGLIAGTSAGLSGHKDSAVAPTSYGGYGGYGGYGPSAVPANSVNPFALIGSSIKEVVNAGLKVTSSLISALTGILGASSKDPTPSYGPPPNSYGRPSNGYGSSSTAAPITAQFTRTTRPPKRQQRF